MNESVGHHFFFGFSELHFTNFLIGKYGQVEFFAQQSFNPNYIFMKISSGMIKYMETAPVRSANIQLIVKTAIVIGLAFLSLCLPPIQIFKGLDMSWAFGINFAKFQGLKFGSDILFTYGPFGYLLVPKAIGNNVVHAIYVQFFFAFIWCGLLIYASFRWLSLRRLIMVGFFWLLVLPVIDLTYTMVIIGLSCLVLSENLKLSFFCLNLACILALFIAFAKFSLGIATVGVVFTALSLRTVSYKDGRILLWLSAGVTSGIFILITVYAQFGGVRFFFRWILAGIHLSSGYSTALSLKGPEEELILALICFAAYILVITLNLFGKEKEDRFKALICMVPVFLFFKHGFVRQDGHVLSFAAGFLLLICTVSLFMKSRDAFNNMICLACLGVLFYVLVSGNHKWGPTYDRVFGTNSCNVIKHTICL